MKLELEEKRLEEKYKKEREEKMITDAKLWKLMINSEFDMLFSSKDAVIEKRLKLKEMQLLEEEEKRISEMTFKILHKIRVASKKKPKIKSKIKKS